jgi:hypothetical protein
MIRGDHWIQASRLVKKVGYLPQTVKNCVYEYHLKRVNSEPTLFAHFRFMNTSSGVVLSSTPVHAKYVRTSTHTYA